MPVDHSELLRRHSLRSTPQRRAILGAFAGGDAEHLSAEEVHARALRSVPELGRGTVYATLAELAELGLLGSVGAPEPVRYETNATPHDHFRCRLCMRLFDISVAAPSTTGLTKEGFSVERVSVVVEGVCADCGRYEKGLVDGARSLIRQGALDDEILASLACSRMESPLGPLALAASSLGIVRIAFEDHADFDPLIARARSRKGSRTARERLVQATSVVDAFFSGSERQGEDAFDREDLSVADANLLEATRLVPYGETQSYERLPGDLSPYARGFAFGSNPMPIIFPCHRITRGSEMPSAYVGGAARREAILAVEREGRAPGL